MATDLADFAILKAVEELAKALSNGGTGRPHFEDTNYKAKEFDAANLRQLNPAAKKICFVDGGSAIIMEAPNFAIAAHRIHYSKYSGVTRERTKLPNTMDFFSLTVSKYSQGRINYETQVYYDDKDAARIIPDKSDLIFDSFDKTMGSGPSRADISHVAMTAREFSEWRTLALIAEYEDAEIIVRDGSLQAVKTNESKYAADAFTACANRGIVLCGVSKTSTLLTTTGIPLLSAIESIANENGFSGKSWLYKNIVEINNPEHNAEMFAAKLHPASQYVFRVEISKNSAEKAQDTINALAANAADFSFPGYPYGLINADIMGRVPNDEAHYHRIKTMAAAGNTAKTLETNSKTRDAHDVLDSM
ncbi:MAG: DNA double-strand break repair nuclease NurA [Candidatus Aenigmarchaeota archaeon]|nr:DNA double-strand break repair nuclease NurA [Candidatus Aenigmarchaeota archaeon]